MAFHLHHQVVDVDQFPTDRQALERRLRQSLLEAVVVLDQLGQGALWEEQRHREATK